MPDPYPRNQIQPSCHAFGWSLGCITFPRRRLTAGRLSRRLYPDAAILALAKGSKRRPGPLLLRAFHV